MENQHRKITGYRDLNQKEIDLMNEIKEQGITLQKLMDKLRVSPTPEGIVVDPRWVSIGRTHLQQGLMALTRAIAKPDFF